MAVPTKYNPSYSYSGFESVNPASPENFDEQIGHKIARDNARGKIWALEGYLLRQRLADAELARVTGGAIV